MPLVKHVIAILMQLKSRNVKLLLDATNNLKKYDILKALETMRIQFYENSCKIVNEDSTIQCFARYLVNDLPPVEKTAEANISNTAIIERAIIHETLKRTLALVDRENKTGLCLFSPDTLTIQNKALKRGQGKFFVPVESDSEFELVISLPALSNALGAFVEGPIKFGKAENGQYLILNQDKFQAVVPLTIM